MNNNFWSRSRSMKGLNHLVDDCFLRIDENNKREDETDTHEDSDAESTKDTDNSSDYEESKPKKDKIHKYYDAYFFEDEYLNKNIEYDEIIKTSNVTEQQV
ncbi:unnamed protein product [Hanseniaspora opuntiae]